MSKKLVFIDQSVNLMSTPINWNLCIICQSQTCEKLQCPADSLHLDIGCGYTSLSDVLAKFAAIGALPRESIWRVWTMDKVYFQRFQITERSGISRAVMLRVSMSWIESWQNSKVLMMLLLTQDPVRMQASDVAYVQIWSWKIVTIVWFQISTCLSFVCSIEKLHTLSVNLRQAHLLH